MKKYIDSEVLRKDILECRIQIPPNRGWYTAMAQALDVIDHQPSVQLADVNDIIQDLREYAEAKFQHGELEMAHGILKAVCRIKQTFDKNE